MKSATMVLLVLFGLTLPEIGTIRSSYKRAIDSEAHCKSTLEILEPITAESPLLYAYKGSLTALLAKHATNPATKLDKVKTASTMLDDAVIADPNNIEIRYLRFSVEKNIPSFLPYREHIKQDETKIILALCKKTDGLPNEVKKDVASYMLKNVQLEPETKKLLESLTR